MWARETSGILLSSSRKTGATMALLRNSFIFLLFFLDKKFASKLFLLPVACDFVIESVIN